MYYQLTSTDLDPDAVTAATGITPTKGWRVGDVAYVTGRRTVYRKTNGWRVQSDPSMSKDLDDHVLWVLGRLEAGWTALSILGRQYDAVLQCVIDTAEWTGPAMGFDPDVIARLAELHAAIDVDYYGYRAGLSENER